MSNLFFINTAKRKMKIKSVFNVLGKQKTKIHFEFHFPVPLKNSWH